MRSHRTNRNVHTVVPAFAVFASILAIGGLAHGSASLELYGNFETLGIIVTIDAADDPDGDASATVEYRAASDAYAAAFPLTRTRETQFAGSLFGLDPGTSFDVRISITDPDGGTLDGSMLSATGTTRIEITIPSATTTYRVSPGGSGTICTAVTPCSLTYGLQQALPGEEVVLGGGTYFEGELNLSRSGAAGSPIVIRAADGETPVLDGSDPQDFVWAADGGGVFQTTVNAPGTHLVTADGQRLYPYQTLSDLQNLEWGLPGFFTNGTNIRVRLEDDADPNGHSMRVSRHNHAFRIGGLEFIYVVGLSFRYYGLGSYAKAIYLDDSSNCLIRNCDFKVCDLGIGIKRQADENTVEHSSFSDTTFDWVWEAVKDGAGLETGGIRIYDSLPSGRGTVIRSNTFRDFFDGFGICPDSDTGTTIETDVHNNLVERVGDDGFETDGYCSNLRIWGNEIRDALVGISLAPVYRGPVYAIRNLIHRTGAGNSQAGYTGSCFKFNSGFGTSGSIYLFHNTCNAIRTGNDAVAIKSPGSWEMVHSRNNIWSATRYSISNSNPTQPLDMDYDALFTSLAGELVWWDGLPDRHLNTLSELQAATGQEFHGLNVDPLFTNAAAEDYRLLSASQLVDAALVIPGINDRYDGSGPDIGAYERSDAVFSDGFESGDPTSWSRVVP